MAHTGSDGDGGRGGLWGPWRALMAVLVGAAIGGVVSWAAPGGLEAHDAPPATDQARPGVIETRPDGTSTVIVPLPESVDRAHRSPGQPGQPTSRPAPSGRGNATPLWLCIPFGLLLLSIATMPLVNE